MKTRLIFKLFVFIPVSFTCPIIYHSRTRKAMIDIQRGEDTKLLLFQTLIALIGKICLFFSLPMHKSAKNKAQSTKRCMEIIFLYSISEGPNDFNLWKYL